MSKFFAIIVEDLGDENGRMFTDADRFIVSTIVQPPTDCEVFGCVEVSPQQVAELLERGRIKGNKKR